MRFNFNHPKLILHIDRKRSTYLTMLLYSKRSPIIRPSPISFSNAHPWEACRPLMDNIRSQNIYLRIIIYIKLQCSSARFVNNTKDFLFITLKICTLIPNLTHCDHIQMGSHWIIKIFCIVSGIISRDYYPTSPTSQR